MKIERFENDKIKVSITNAELLLYNIDEGGVNPSSPRLHKFLFDVMENIKEETGFNPYSGQVVVEAVQDSGGITLFISKLKTVSTPKKIVPKNIKGIKATKRIHKNRYLFESFDNLCAAFKLADEKDLEKGSLYKFQNKWYVVCPSGEGNIHSLFSEYCDYLGEIVHGETFLKEHGTLLAENEKLISMVKGIKTLD